MWAKGSAQLRARLEQKSSALPVTLELPLPLLKSRSTQIMKATHFSREEITVISLAYDHPLCTKAFPPILSFSPHNSSANGTLPVSCY